MVTLMTFLWRCLSITLRKLFIHTSRVTTSLNSKLERFSCESNVWPLYPPVMMIPCVVEGVYLEMTELYIRSVYNYAYIYSNSILFMKHCHQTVRCRHSFHRSLLTCHQLALHTIKHWGGHGVTTIKNRLDVCVIFWITNEWKLTVLQLFLKHVHTII